MAIKHIRSTNGEITQEEFKERVKTFDIDGDGRIGKSELHNAIRAVPGRFSGWESFRGFRQADTDCNGFIDDTEIDNLINFA